MNLPKELLESIVEQVSKEFSKTTRIKKEQEKDWRLRNTRYLLVNYRKLQSHCKASLEEIKLHDDILKDIRVNSVAEYKAKTIKMMDYVDMMLKSYESYCKEGGQATNRRWSVFKRKYLDSGDLPTNSTLANQHGVDERTIRRDESKAIEEFSVYLFGISHLTDLIDENEMSELCP